MEAYIVWSALFIVMCIVEANTANLTTIWFAAGALVTLIAIAIGIPPAWQIPVFVISSAVFVLLTRPIVKKKLMKDKEKTNLDMVVGKAAIVRESITPDKFSGMVTVGGKMWSAVSADGGIIEEGEEVSVEAIDGVKLVVSKKIKAEV